MSGRSLCVTLITCATVCSFVVCSTQHAPPDTHSSLRRFYRSDGEADTSGPKTDHLPNSNIKPTPDNKPKEVKNNQSSSVSPTVNVTPKSEDSKNDKHPNPSAGGTQHNLNQGALLRGFYVFVGLSAIVVIYIVVRTISVRRKKSTVRKYGILTNREDVEMTPLGAEDDEEDTTLFDVSNQTRP